MTTDASKQLVTMLSSTTPDMQGIARFLDALPHVERVSATQGLDAKSQAKLWRAAEGFRSLRLIDLVPAETPPMKPVVHFGKNSLPVFSRFEKRFYRPVDTDATAPELVYGANFQRMSPFTGPGYFVVVPDATPGQVLVDYRRLPERIPEGWPALVSNERGISRFVYGYLTDALRGVSQHVTIGFPARHGEPLGTYFVLCREAV